MDRLKLVDRHVIRVHVRFGASDKARWEIKCMSLSRRDVIYDVNPWRCIT